MVGVSQGGSTAVDKDVLTRLIAAALVSEAVPWADAANEAEREAAVLWGRLTPAEQALPVEVSTDMLFHLVAAAHTTISASHARGSEWARRVERDLAEVRRVAGSAEGAES